MKILYHGSDRIIDCPKYGLGKLNNDYGRGFYCTEYLELAKEWSCTKGKDGYVNVYELDMEGLRVLDLTSDEYSVLNWLAILMDNRIVRMSNLIEKRGRDYLLTHFLPDYKDYDLIIGYRADDSYFSFARLFVNNTISLEQLSYALKLGKLGEQYTLISEKAFCCISLKNYIFVSSSEYYPKRIHRDEEARNSFFEMVEDYDMDGIYIRDIIREGMVNI